MGFHANLSFVGQLGLKQDLEVTILFLDAALLQLQKSYSQQVRAFSKVLPLILVIHSD